MLTALKLWNFGSGSLISDELSGSAFILRTCQRTLVLSFNEHTPAFSVHGHCEVQYSQDAYLFLLETICGLKSKLIGENEIVGQFKEAYKLYALSTRKDTRLMLVLEKLFKDAKDIRTQYLIGISQKTYASLTRKHLIQKAKAKRVVVLGSGQLAEDLINQFKKKAEVVICARNHARVQELMNTHQIKSIPWDEREKLIHNPFIANTIGHETILFDKNFFSNWTQSNKEHLFVDLGSPSVIKTELTLEEGVVRLQDIFNEGAILEGQKQEQIELARKTMHDITQKRKSLFEEKLNRSLKLGPPQIKADMRYL